MAEIIWTEPAVEDLGAIADYIALDNEKAAQNLVRQVFDRVSLLKQHPKMGSIPKDLRPEKRYRHLVIPPCRIFYRISGSKIYIVHIMRSEQLLDYEKLT